MIPPADRGLRPDHSPRPDSAPRPDGAPRPDSGPRPDGPPQPNGAPRPNGALRPDGAPRSRKVVVWQHDQARIQHDVIGLGDIQADTEYGRLLVRSLTRAQLGLSLMCLALAGAVIASVPVIMALLPSARKATVAGLPLTLIVLGAGIFPVLMVIGWFYNRQASQLEARFIDLVDPVGRRLE